MRITSWEIIRTRTEDGEHWRLTGSPIAIRKALEGKIKSQAALDKWVKNEKGEIITLENLDQMLQDATQKFTNPSVLLKRDFDRLWTWRFFSKLALAAGHYFFGDAFSRSWRGRCIQKDDECPNCRGDSTSGCGHISGAGFTSVSLRSLQSEGEAHDRGLDKKPRGRTSGKTRNC